MNNIDYRIAKKCILPVLLSKAALNHFPDNIISIDFLGLSIVFVYIPGIDKEKSTFVNKKLLDSFQVSEDINYSKIILFFDAINAARRKQPAEICSLSNILQLSALTEEDFESKIFVLSAQYGVYGASAMLDVRVLERFAGRIGESFNIIPSSIHEVLLIPDSVGIGSKDLHQMLLEVNSSVLLPDEVLSTDIYRFDRNLHKLVVLRI